MCRALIVPSRSHDEPLLRPASAWRSTRRSPRSARAASALSRGCTPIFARIWCAPSCATVCGFRNAEQLRLVPVPLRLLVEEDPIGEDLVIGLDLRVDLLVRPEIRLRGEDHRHQRELRLVDRDVVAAADVDQAAVEVLEQPGAVLGERELGLVEDQVMRRREHLESGVRALLQPRPQLVGRHRARTASSVGTSVLGKPSWPSGWSSTVLPSYWPCRRATTQCPASSRIRKRLASAAAEAAGGAGGVDRGLRRRPTAVAEAGRGRVGTDRRRDGSRCTAAIPREDARGSRPSRRAGAAAEGACAAVRPPTRTRRPPSGRSGSGFRS